MATEIPAGNPFGSAPSAPSAPSRAAAPAENPRANGHSPALEARQAHGQSEPAPAKIKVGGSEFAENEVREALARKAEGDIRKAALPSSPEKYELKLPENFEAPVGVRFEPDLNDPLYELARREAHARGLDQETFSALYGVFAAAEIGKQTRLENVRQENLKQLGSAAGQRIDAISTFLTAHADKDGAAVGEFLRRYPSAPIVRTLERIIHDFSSQGAADYRQNGRAPEEPKPPIPSMEKGATYAQVRAAQDALAQALDKRKR